ncbi:MAG: TlpA disulfide reductase family protein [Saonia sp.]
MTKDKLINGILLLLVILYLFTPLGFHMKVQMNKWFSFSPSALEEKEQQHLADYDWRLVGTDGVPFNLEEGKDKVVLVNFWATWCPPCVAEMPSFQKLYDVYGDSLVFIFLASDDETKVQTFLTKKNYTFPVYFARTNAPVQLEHSSIPTTYIIDKNGKIIVKKVGAADWDPDTVSDLLDSLLKV